jgi:hypothetical protein
LYMRAEFFAMARYQMALPGTVGGVDGGLILASGLPFHVLVRRNLDRTYPHLVRRLFDPQLYLTGLQNPAVSRKACANLSSYGWFPVGERLGFSSAELKQADWNREVRATIHRHWVSEVQSQPSDIEAALLSCLDMQKRIGCEGFILPSPLTTDLGTDYSLELAWLDHGLELSAKSFPDTSRFATVAISDSCLRSQDPWSNSLLDLILDQICARRPEGVYIVLEAANEGGYYINHPNTIGSLLRLVSGMKDGGIGTVSVAYAGIAGLMAVAVGADTWSAGWYRGERRLKLSDFEDDEGRSVPTYYSYPLASEVHVDKDLDWINGEGFLERIADSTDASAGLLRALREGRPTNSVPEWRYQRANVRAAKEHFVAAAVRETMLLKGMNRAQRIDRTRKWLYDADRIASELMARGSFNPRTALNHQANWLQALERFVREGPSL